MIKSLNYIDLLLEIEVNITIVWCAFGKWTKHQSLLIFISIEVLIKLVKKTILVKTMGHDKNRFTVALSYIADGTKQKPMIPFKRKTMPKEELPTGVFMQVHPKGWMDERCKKWLNHILNYHPGGLLRKKSWNTFKWHPVEDVKIAVRRQNTNIPVIPGGLTSFLQPLEVSINKPSKDCGHGSWNEWMLNGEKSFKKGQCMSTTLDDGM